MSIAALALPASKRNLHPESMEAAAERRKNLGFLKLNLVEDPTEGLHVLRSSLRNSSNDRLDPDNLDSDSTDPVVGMWKRSSTAGSEDEWQPRGLIATQEYLYIVSRHKKDTFTADYIAGSTEEISMPASPSEKKEKKMYGVVDKIPMHSIIEVQPVPLVVRNEETSQAHFADICIRSNGHDEANTNGFVVHRRHTAAKLAGFRITVQDPAADESASQARACCNSTASAAPPPAMPERTVEFSTGVGPKAESDRDDWVHDLRTASTTAARRFLLVRRAQNAQRTLHCIYSSSPLQAVVVCAILANFAVSLAQVPAERPPPRAGAARPALRFGPASPNPHHAPPPSPANGERGRESRRQSRYPSRPTEPAHRDSDEQRARGEARAAQPDPLILSPPSPPPPPPHATPPHAPHDQLFTHLKQIP